MLAMPFGFSNSINILGSCQTSFKAMCDEFKRLVLCAFAFHASREMRLFSFKAIGDEFKWFVLAMLCGLASVLTFSAAVRLASKQCVMNSSGSYYARLLATLRGFSNRTCDEFKWLVLCAFACHAFRFQQAY